MSGFTARLVSDENDTLRIRGNAADSEQKRARAEPEPPCGVRCHPALYLGSEVEQTPKRSRLRSPAPQRPRPGENVVAPPNPGTGNDKGVAIFR